MVIKARTRPKKHEREKYAIINISKKDLSKNIRKFEKSSYESYKNKRPNHEPTESYFYLTIELSK